MTKYLFGHHTSEVGAGAMLEWVVRYSRCVCVQGRRVGGPIEDGVRMDLRGRVRERRPGSGGHLAYMQETHTCGVTCVAGRRAAWARAAARARRPARRPATATSRRTRVALRTRSAHHTAPPRIGLNGPLTNTISNTHFVVDMYQFYSTNN